MNTVKCLIVCTLLFLAPFSNGVTAPTNPLSKINRLPPSLEQIVQKVTGKLMERGYEVKRGYWALWGGDQCKYTISVLGRCYGPNPTAPYVVPFVPSWRDEFVDHSLHKVFGPERRGYAPIYRLDEREALVILAVLPPRARISACKRPCSPEKTRLTKMTRYTATCPRSSATFFSPRRPTPHA